MQIERPDIKNLEFLEEEFEMDFVEEIDFTIDSIKKGTYRNFGPEINNALDAIHLALVLNKPKADILSYFDLLIDYTIANYQVAMHPNEDLVLNIHQQSLPFKGYEKYSFIDVDTWANGFYAAVITRNQIAISFFQGVPEKLLEASELKGAAAFDFKVVEFLKELFVPKGQLGQLLIEAFEAQNTVAASRQSYVNHIRIPELDLYHAYLDHDTNAFNENLEKALKQHLAYWGTKDQAYNSKGWHTLPILAVCALAYDTKKLEPSVQSNYLPEWLIKAEF